METDGRATLAEQVADLLKRQILAGSPAPGGKLPPEVTLAQELGVNRFTVRAAMNQLEQLRLVQRRPGAGTVVLDWRLHASIDVLEYLVVRPDGSVDAEVLAHALEFAALASSEVAALAAERREDAHLAELEVLVARMRGETSLSRLFWLDFDLSRALASAARNVVPILLLNSVRELLEKYTRPLETLWVVPGTIGEGHEHVVRAVRAREADRARQLMRWIWTARHQRFLEAAPRFATPRADAARASLPRLRQRSRPEGQRA